MKVRNLILGITITAGLWLTAPAHAAPTCQVPAFLKQGASYHITIVGGSIPDALVTEIDKDFCWIKIGNIKNPGYAGLNGAWLNLSQIIGIKPLGQ